MEYIHNFKTIMLVFKRENNSTKKKLIKYDQQHKIICKIATCLESIRLLFKIDSFY